MAENINALMLVFDGYPAQTVAEVAKQTAAQMNSGREAEHEALITAKDVDLFAWPNPDKKAVVVFGADFSEFDRQIVYTEKFIGILICV